MNLDALLWWMLTYALHSSLLLGGTWLFTLKGIRSEPLRDTLWKAALVGGVLTATVQVLAGWQPSYSIAVSPSVAAMAPPSGSLNPGIQDRVSEAGRPYVSVENSKLSAAPDVLSPPGELDRTGRSIAVWLLVFWALGAGVALFRLTVAQLRLTRMLRSRQPVTTPALLAALEELSREAGVRRPVRLTQARGLATPVALGSSEICFPPRAVTGLDAEQQRCVLAHELAHLVRRDPLWLNLLCLLESVFFFQPLNRLGRRRFQELSEYLCDDWAVRHTGGALTLARCLAEIAGWVTPPIQRLALTAIAESGPPLTRRVQRLLTNTHPPASPAWWTRVAMATGVLALAAGFAPGVSQEYARQPKSSGQPGTTSASADWASPRAVTMHVLAQVTGESTTLARGQDTPKQLIYGSGPEDTSRIEWIHGPFWQPADEVRGRIEFQTRGRIVFSPDGAIVRTITDGGHLIVEERDTSSVRRIEVRRAADGGVQYAYSVDGMPRIWNDSTDGQRWLGPLVRELVRVAETESGGAGAG